MHWVPSSLDVYPPEHWSKLWHLYDPFVLIHLWLRRQGLNWAHSSISVDFGHLIIENVANRLKIENRMITNTSALIASLESFVAWAVALIIVDLSWYRCCCMWPNIQSTAIRLCIRWIVLCVHVWTFRGCRRRRGGGSCWSRCVAWLLATEWSFRITTFVWFYAIVTTQCTFIIIFKWTFEEKNWSEFRSFL